MVRQNRLTIVVAIAVLTLGSIQAEAAGGTRLVTLDQAERIAQENSVGLRLSELDLQEAEFEYKQAQAATIMRPSPAKTMQAQLVLNLARQKYLMDKDKLSLAVKTDFFNVLKMQSMVEIAGEGLDSANRHADVAHHKFAVGTVTELEVIKATRGVLSAKAGLFRVQQGLDLAALKFHQTLGVDLDAKIMPERAAFDYIPVEIDLNKDLQFALTNRDEIRQLQAAIEVAKKSIELADNDYTPGLTLEQHKIRLAKLEAQVEQARQGLTLEIRQSYSALKDAEKQIPVLEKGVEEASEMLRLSELSYETNMITSNDVQDARLGMQSAKNDLVIAVFEYNLAKAKYFHAVGKALQGLSPQQ